MTGPTETIAAALAEADRLRMTLKKKTTRQVTAQDERALAKATALAWFNVHKKVLVGVTGPTMLQDVDALYQKILDASDHSTARNTYATSLKALREALIAARRDALSVSNSSKPPTTDIPPSFSPLTSDPNMQAILEDRWRECIRCIGAEAPLSATVMMGGLLETLLLGRINRESDKGAVFKAPSAPKDRKTGQPKPLGEWMLRDYIDVTHDLKWITVSAKEVAVVLRDFRNYIHPHKQLLHGVHLNNVDAALFWEVSKNIAIQVLRSCAP
jgi:hypothetical protein